MLRSMESTSGGPFLSNRVQAEALPVLPGSHQKQCRSRFASLNDCSVVLGRARLVA